MKNIGSMQQRANRRMVRVWRRRRNEMAKAKTKAAFHRRRLRQDRCAKTMASIFARTSDGRAGLASIALLRGALAAPRSPCLQKHLPFCLHAPLLPSAAAPRAALRITLLCCAFSATEYGPYQAWQDVRLLNNSLFSGKYFRSGGR